jgi:nitrite reductase (NADH) large subunit
VKKIIVIGTSAASISFIAKLRSFDKESSILCFSADVDLPYNRCFLADFLTNDIDLPGLFLKPESFFAQNNVQVFLNHRAVNFDFAAQKVLIETNHIQTWHGYDYIFLGMGCAPFVPLAFAKAQMAGIFTFHTLSDMQHIDRWIAQQHPKTAIVIGAGLNGVEAASALQTKGVAVTLIEAAAHILPGQLDVQAAEFVTQKAIEHNTSVLVGHKVTGLHSQNNKIHQVQLDDGRMLGADLVIITAGSIPNTKILQNTGIELTAGLVRVDRYLKTNFDTVFAGGDLCQVSEVLTGLPVRSTTWSDAMLQGLCAATNLSAAPRIYPGIIGLRDSYFFGKDFYACGQTCGHDEQVQVIQNVDAENLKKLYVKDARLVGFVLIGDVSALSQCKQWYVTQQPLDQGKI